MQAHACVDRVTSYVNICMRYLRVQSFPAPSIDNESRAWSRIVESDSSWMLEMPNTNA
jgi:hypothetical protein